MQKTKPVPATSEAKQSILRAAYAITRDLGVDQLSAGKIAQKAGISKSGFFHHFRQVDDLYLYILDDLLLTLQQNILQEKPATFSALIDSMAETLLTAHETNPEILIMLLYFFSLSKQKQAYAERLRALLLNIFSSWEKQLGDYFGEALPKDDLDNIVRLVDAFFLGTAIHNLLLGDSSRYRRLTHQFGEMLQAFYETKTEYQKELH